MNVVLVKFRLVLAAVLLLAALDASAADRAAQHKTQQRNQTAIKAYAAGEYAKALDLYAQLYADTLHPVYLRNIGRCHQKMRNPEKAIDAFRDYLAKIERVTDKDRREVEAYIKEMEEMLQGHDVPLPAPAPPLPTASPERPVPIVMIPGATDRAPENETPIYKKWWLWTGVGAVVVGAVAIGIVLSSGGSSRPPCLSGVTCK